MKTYTTLEEHLNKLPKERLDKVIKLVEALTKTIKQ